MSAKIHESLAPVSFLVGKWQTVDMAKGVYPTIEPFQYHEEIEFVSVGQPVLNYYSKTRHSVSLKPMHLESGYLRVKPGTSEVAFMVAHNFGLTSMEEGYAIDNILSLESKDILRMSFGKDPAVAKICRSYTYDENADELNFCLKMETTNTPLQDHLSATYKRM